MRLGWGVRGGGNGVGVGYRGGENGYWVGGVGRGANFGLEG